MHIFGWCLLFVLAVFMTAPVTWMIRKLIGLPTTNYEFTAEDITQARENSKKEGNLHRKLVALDIFCNVLFLNGQQDETISTHSWRAAKLGKTWGKFMLWWLDLFQPNHGPKAAAGDMERAYEREAIEKENLS